MKDKRIRVTDKARPYNASEFIAQNILTKAIVDSRRLRKISYLQDIRDFIEKERDWFNTLCDIAGEPDEMRIYNMIDVNLRQKGI